MVLMKHQPFYGINSFKINKFVILILNHILIIFLGRGGLKTFLKFVINLILFLNVSKL